MNLRTQMGWQNTRGKFCATIGASILVTVLSWFGSGIGTKVLGSDAALTMPLAPLRPRSDLDPRKVSLGGKLFVDPQLSSKGMLSCNSCHDLTKGGTVGRSRTVGYEGKRHLFNSPTIFNAAINYRLGWRGELTSLEKQNEKVLLDKNLMDMNWKTLILRLRENGEYRDAFTEIYGQSLHPEDVLDALATFQRSLVTTNAAFDRYLEGDETAISRQARTGFELFQTYGCASCHQGTNVGGNMFQKFGVFADILGLDELSDEGDLGRWTVTGSDDDKGVFRVPSLRNVEVTAPYFHDGRVATLKEAVEVMARSQLGTELLAEDAEAIIAFLKSLTGEYNGRRLSETPLEIDR